MGKSSQSLMSYCLKNGSHAYAGTIHHDNELVKRHLAHGFRDAIPSISPSQTVHGHSQGHITHLRSTRIAAYEFCTAVVAICRNSSYFEHKPLINYFGRTDVVFRHSTHSFSCVKCPHGSDGVLTRQWGHRLSIHEKRSLSTRSGRCTEQTSRLPCSPLMTFPVDPSPTKRVWIWFSSGTASRWWRSGWRIPVRSFLKR